MKSTTAVMNYTEMEAKVREATNNEPWGKDFLSRCASVRTDLLRGIIDNHAGNCQRDV